MTTYSQLSDFEFDEERDYFISETAAHMGSGCFSPLILPLVAVILVGSLLFVFSMNIDIATINGGYFNPYFSSQQGDTAAASLLINGKNDSTVKSGIISSIFTPQIQAWAPSISRWAEHAGIEPNLAAVVMQIESCGNPKAISRAGAMGLFQVMPFHFAARENPYDPDINAARGLEYLSRALESAGGDVRTSLAGYNGGIGVIGIPEFRWKEQTRRYVTYGFPMYQDAMGGGRASHVLKQWYLRFGVNLCREAGEVLGLHLEPLFQY